MATSGACAAGAAAVGRAIRFERRPGEERQLPRGRTRRGTAGRGPRNLGNSHQNFNKPPPGRGGIGPEFSEKIRMWRQFSDATEQVGSDTRAYAYDEK